MTKIKNNSVLICIDFINEIVSEGGKLSGKGYLQYHKDNNTLQKVKELQDLFREENQKIIHVKVAFNKDYSDHPSLSPLFGKAKDFNALEADTNSTEFNTTVAPLKDEKVIRKNRVSAFFRTSLDNYLNENNIESIYLSGVSTDLAIQSAARDAHDRDYNVIIVEDCCIAASVEDHKNSLTTLSKISQVTDLKSLK